MLSDALGSIASFSDPANLAVSENKGLIAKHKGAVNKLLDDQNGYSTFASALKSFEDRLDGDRGKSE